MSLQRARTLAYTTQSPKGMRKNLFQGLLFRATQSYLQSHSTNTTTIERGITIQ